jgi:YD repeat-containing protein
VENKNYYLPSFGIANINDASHDTNRLYSFKPGNLDFSSWANYYYQSFESNGIIGILFLILSIYRDIVFNQVGFFPFLFLHGDYGTGKTSFVERLLSVFGKDTIGIALNNATITALSRIVSTRFNSLFYLKEYTSDTDESAQDFILTAYDGAGRTTGIKSNDNRTQSLVIKSGIILDGNELPVEKSAVFSRMILASFEKQNFSDQQKQAFDRLKQEAEIGLGNVLLDILKHREYFAGSFKETYSQILKELKGSEPTKNLKERMLNHMALLLAPLRVLEDKLQFPFDLQEATDRIIERAINQDEVLKETNAVTIFWNAVAYGIRKAEINVYHNDLNNKFADIRIKSDGSSNGIVQIKYQNLHPFYVAYCRRNNIKYLDKSSLKKLLTSEANKSFIRSSQNNRGLTYTDKVFGSCYQFSCEQKGNSIEINEVEIML